YLPTGGHPVIYGEIKGASPKTLLMYGHYDVQPPDPLDAWKYPPFGAEMHDGCIWGRGTSDHKGSLVSRLQAVEALEAVLGRLPITVKFLIEGEEEIGSPNLPPTIQAHRELLRADGCLYPGGF